ncbi:MAG: leucine-rich repeat domain-containing protein [Treponema sp.]|nr:leucine-rich repeat domain-containing protein [Treponema sp.]
MKKLGFLFIVLSFSIIFSACPPLEEDDLDGLYSGTIITFDEPFELDVYKWFEILDNIAKERKYVSLDLSKGTFKVGNTAGGLIEDTAGKIAFDPFPAASSGKNFIIKITLPVSTQVINQAVDDSDISAVPNEEFIEDTKKLSAFRSFTKLRSVKADNVTLIGNFAFAGCTELREVIFPRVGHNVSDTETIDDSKSSTYCRDIGKYAFLGCTELKEVKFNSAAVIAEYAFKDCTNLSKIDFPEVWIIERNAFESCESLVNVFFEKTSKIGEEAFKNCTGLKKAEFNVAPEDRAPVGSPLTGTPCDYDSVIFYTSAFNGCKAFEVLNVRRAWNVYFLDNVLANTGTSVKINLFDEPSGSGLSHGHPQNKKFLGDGITLSLKEVNILVPGDGYKIRESSPDNIANYIWINYTNPIVKINVNRE